jgi:hypothetical protein
VLDIFSDKKEKWLTIDIDDSQKLKKINFVSSLNDVVKNNAKSVNDEKYFELVDVILKEENIKIPIC